MATAADLLAGTRERDIAIQQQRQQQAQNAVRQAETDARYAASGAQEAAAARQAGAARLANAAIRPYRPQPTFAPSAAGAGRGMVNPPLVTPDPSASPLAQMDPTSPARQDPANPMKPEQGASAALASPVTAAKEVRPGIYRQGNSFSDTAEGAASGARPAPISAQNMAAADQLAARYATQNPLVKAAQPQQPQGGAYIPQDTGGFGLLDKGYQQRRSAMMDVQQMKPGSGKALAALLQQQTDAPKFDLERDRLAQAGEESAADRLMRGQELNAKIGESQADRALRGEELADNRLTSAAKREALGVETGAAKQLADLRTAYMNAKTPEEQAAVAAKLNALQGKAPAADWGVQVTPGVKNIDGSTTEGSVYRFNKATGEVQRVDGQQKPAGTAMPPPNQRPVGATSTVNGKTAVWNGTKWVPQ